MDTNLVLAIVTSVCTAGSTNGVAITALMLSNKRIDLVEASLDRLNAQFDFRIERVETSIQRLNAHFEARFDSMEARFELLTGALHDIDKRLSIIEDRVGR
jgi:hypothetical protein